MKLFEPKIIYFDFEVFKGTGICIETVQHFLQLRFLSFDSCITCEE